MAETSRGKRVLETSHPPTYYFPAADIKLEHLIKADKRGVCEWKGRYEYYDISIGNQNIPAAAWRYFEPTPDFVAIQQCYGFIANLMDACFVNDERVTPSLVIFMEDGLHRMSLGRSKVNLALGDGKP